MADRRHRFPYLKKVGIYGGTFDPIHHGHLLLAREAMEELGLDQVIFVLAAVSPHKAEHPRTEDRLRLQMLTEAVAGEPHFSVDARELNRPPPSYTIDTIESLRSEHPKTDLFYFLGDDNLPKLHTWHRYEQLRKMVTFVVLRRGDYTEESHPFLVIDRKIDISGTEIRKRVAGGCSIQYLVPPAVEKIIRQNNLYKEPAK